MDILDRFKLIADEFAGLDNDIIKSYLDMADEQVRKNISSPARDELICYLAAHIMTLSLERRGAGGDVSARTLGRATIQYNSPSNPKDDYDLSSYGRYFKRRYRSFIFTVLTSTIQNVCR